MTIEYLDLADFLVIAEEITGIEAPVLMKRDTWADEARLMIELILGRPDQ